ncbi:MAG: HAMP domain-containing histidine kinase, partial [Spirosomaceae bacterium]|nr:HAMP domain-containing histidine kinase [Spirosomataceae bacterium]
EISRSVFMKNDLIFEKFIASKINEIETDKNIKAAIVEQKLGWERVTQQVKDNYLNGLVNGYLSVVYVFGTAGNSLDILPGSQSLSELENEISGEGTTISKYSVVRKSVGGDDAVFYGKATINSADGDFLGTVIIKLDELLLTQNLNNLKEYQRLPAFNKNDLFNYSFAVFDSENKLTTSEGSFNYLDTWNSRLTQSEKLFTVGVADNSGQHYGFKNQDGRTLIVSLPNNDLLRDWANLSFLFLLSVFAISFILVIYSFRHGYSKRSQMNFTTRIQLYLNTAFLLPLLLILIIAISVVGTTLRRNQENGFRENAASLASTIQLLASDLFSGRMSRAYYEQELDELAQSSKVGFSIYDESGKRDYLAIADFDNLPLYLNPNAFSALLEKNDKQVLLEEKLYKDAHLTSYVSVRPLAKAQKLVIGVPHIDSGIVLERQLKTVVSSILNIFIFLFVFLLVAAFFVSRQLTNPIRTVTGHLRKTNLDKLNEPLPLEETNDEMGVLVRAYNRMLKKLEESKMALSDSEKQTAWREMAKQVAHEIKNPLTPMKLSIQQLQRTLPLDNPKSKQRIERALNSLNEQIDNISEIANSFSEFAKMPVPRSEEFDLVEVIQKVTDLYTTNKNSDFHLNFLQPKLLVRGDRQLMSRVLTNLIINGLQSVPIDKRPIIEIAAYKNEEDNFAILEVRDNGVGVPEEIREKVFIPNFSTKVGGSGLGLALAKRGIEHGGGNIWFDTEVGIGTTFYVDLPLS